jgi:5-methylcytosine-specific restriction endonuclease McrA
MIRRVPPVTRTPLRRHTPLPRPVAGLRPQRRRHVASDTPARRDDLTMQQRATLYTRAGGRCEGALVHDCWGRLPADLWQAAHRRARGQGGDNTALWNRWAACPPCHAWQHDHSDAAAETGHYVRSGLDPHRMPMCLPDGRIVVLDAAGTYQEVAA